MIVRAGDIIVNPGPSFQTLGNDSHESMLDNFTEYESLRGLNKTVDSGFPYMGRRRRRT